MHATDMKELVSTLIDAVSLIGSRKGIQRDDDIETLKIIALELMDENGVLELPMVGRRAELIQQFLMCSVNEKESIIRTVMKHLNPDFPDEFELQGPCEQD